MKDIKYVAIDLAKKSFQVHATNAEGKAILRKKLNRKNLVLFFSNLNPVTIGMEACGGSHYWARTLKAMGHTVKIIAPQFVKPFVKSQKNDSNDAEAIFEAMIRPSMRFVPVKEVDHQDTQALHRARQRVVRNRVALTNEIHGLVGEYGIELPLQTSLFYKRLVELTGAENNEITPKFKWILEKLVSEYELLVSTLADFDQQINELSKTNDVCRRLMTIPGVGPITATALFSAAGNAHEFSSGRQFAAWLGLVPRQHSTGGKTVLLGITKRGSGYLRTLLVHGARAWMQRIDIYEGARVDWAKQKLETKGKAKAYVAQANKSARIAWAIMKKGGEYQAAY